MSQLNNGTEQDLATDFVGDVLKQYNLPSPSHFGRPLSKSLPLPSKALSSAGKPGGISSLKKLKEQAELGDKKLRSSSKQKDSTPPRNSEDASAVSSRSGSVKRKTTTDLFLESIQLENEKLERELQRLTSRSQWEDGEDVMEKTKTDIRDDHTVIQDAGDSIDSVTLSSSNDSRHTFKAPTATAAPIAVESADDTQTTHTKMKRGRLSSADFVSSPLSPSSSSSSSSVSDHIVTNTAEESTYVAEPKSSRSSSPSPRNNENNGERNRWQRFSVPDGMSPPNRKHRTLPENKTSNSNSNLVRTLMGDWSLDDPMDEREDEKGSQSLVENDTVLPSESELFIAANQRSPSVVISASSSSLQQIHSNNNMTTIIGRQRAVAEPDAMLSTAKDAENSPPTWHNDPTNDASVESTGDSPSDLRADSANQDKTTNHKSEKREYINPTNEIVSKEAEDSSNDTGQWDRIEQNITTNGIAANSPSKARPKSAPAIRSKPSNQTKEVKAKEKVKTKEKPTVRNGGKNHFLLEQKLLKERERHVQVIQDERKKESIQKEHYEQEISQLTEKLVRYELRLKGVHNSLRSQQIQLKEKDETIQHLNQEIAKKNRLLESNHTSVGSDVVGSHRSSALNPLPLAVRKKESLLESKISTLEQTVEKYKKQIYRSQEITHSLLNKLREIQHEEDEAVASRFKLQRTVETCSLKLKHCASENKMLKRELEVLKSNEERWRVNYEKLENRYKTVVAESIEFEAKTTNLYNVTQQLQRFIVNEINLSS